MYSGITNVLNVWFGCISQPSHTGQEDTYADYLCQGDTGFPDIR